MNGTASPETPPVSTATGASSTMPHKSSAPVATTLSRDPASSTFHIA
jgi:hypothetical protein